MAYFTMQLVKEVFNIIDNDCSKKPTVLCYIGNKYNIVNTSGELIQNCTDGVSTPGYTNTSTEAHTTDILKNTWVVALSVVVLLLIGGVIVYKRKSFLERIKTMISKTEDTTDSNENQKDKMLNVKLEIEEPNDSSVIMDGESYSVKSPENSSI